MHQFGDKILTQDRLAEILQLEDFTSLESEVHPVNLVMNQVLSNISAINSYGTPDIRRGSPVTTTEENFDALLFPSDSVMRTGLHTYKLSDGRILRTQMSYMVPQILAEGDFDTHRLLVCPGLVYRREGPHHQMDVWYIKRSQIPFARHDVAQMINILVEELIPEEQRILKGKELCYIHDGFKLKAEFQGRPQTFIDGGIVMPEILENAGLNPNEYQAMAIGISLDRLAMYKKGINDPRVLRSTDTRIQNQMSDLENYNQVSKFPPIQRDISVVVDQDVNVDHLNLYLRFNLPPDILAAIETIDLLSETQYEDLPIQARERLGISPEQKNLLVRFNIRSFERTLTKAEANDLRELLFNTINNLDSATIEEYIRLTQES